MKIFNYAFAFIFLISAIIQYNDEDPILWMIIYLYGAVLCFQAAREIYWPKAYLAGIALYLGYAAYLFFFNEGVVDWFQHHQTGDLVQSMKADKPWIEETREFGGLLLLIIAVAVNWVVFWKRKRVEQ